MKWQDYVFISLLVIYIVLQITLISSFKQLPSPIYGGDYYYSMGTVQHVMSGGNPLASSNVLGSEPFYLPFYAIIVSGTGLVFGLSAFAAMKAFAIIELIIALVLFYLFANYLLKNKSLALISLMLYLPLISFPVWKYLQFTITLMMPAFLFSLLYFFKKRSILSAVIAGILFGLMGISHTVGFVTAVFFFVIISLYIIFFEHLHRKDKKWHFDKKSFKTLLLKNIKLLLIIAIIGGVIAMLFWFKPIFVYHGKLPSTSVHVHAYSSLNTQMNFVFGTFKEYFFNFSNIFNGLKSVLFLIGFLSIFFLKRYDSSKRFLVVILLTAFIGSFHYILSQPLLGVNLSPIHIRTFSFGLATALFAGLGSGLISNFLKKYKSYALIGILILLLIFNIQQFTAYSKNDRWINAGRNELSPNLVEMQKWVLKNTDVSEVFLSTNELSFALNGLTGRKEVIGRRAHNSMFLNMDERQADAAIVLYGNDSEERKKLLKEYSVDYLYWDYYWFQSEYHFDNTGEITSWFDPIAFLDTPEYEKLVKKYNLSFFKQHTWLDPTVKSPSMKQFDLIFILPYQFNLTHPWHPDLDNYLEEVWDYKQNNQVISRIYKIVNVD